MQVPLKLKIGKQPEPEQAPDDKQVKKLTVVARGLPSPREGRFADGAFRSLVIACAVSLLVIVGLICFELIKKSGLSTHKFGLKFLTTSVWNPVSGEFGSL